MDDKKEKSVVAFVDEEEGEREKNDQESGKVKEVNHVTDNEGSLENIDNEGDEVDRMQAQMLAVSKKHAELKEKAKNIEARSEKNEGGYEGTDDGEVTDDDSEKPELIRQQGHAEYVVKYDVPDAEMIAHFVRKNHVRDADTGKRFPFFETKLGRLFNLHTVSKGEEAVNNLGPGISSYFHFLLMFSLAFFIFGVLMIPSLFFNYAVGKTLTDIPRFSLGNLFREEDLIDDSVSETYEFGLDGRFSVARRTVAFVEVFLDIFVILLFLILAEFSVTYFQKKEYIWETANPKMEHFTIEVTNLPEKVSYDELKDYFSNLSEKALADSQVDTKGKETQEEALEIAEKEGIRESVVDVQIVTTTRDKLTFALKMAALSKDAEHKEALYVVAQNRRDEGKLSQARFLIISREYSKSVEKLRLYWEKEGEPKSMRQERIIKAFVTFATIGIKMKVLALFHKKKKLKDLCNCFKAPDAELLLRENKLQVTHAAPPSLLKWEHMEYSTSSRKGRGCVAVVGIIITLIISVVSLVVISKAESFDIFSVLDGDQKEAVAEPFDCTEFFENQPESAENLVQTGACSGIEEINEEVDTLCIQAITCFCENGDATETLELPVCQQLILGGLVQTSFLLAAGLLVNIFNVLLEFLIVSSVQFEKDEDRSKEESKLFARMFVATYINTAIVKLFAEINYKELFGVDIPILPEGQYSDFTSEWYAQAGSDVTVIALVNIVAPHALIVGSYIFSNLKRRCVKPISQQDVEKKFLGPDILLPLRYAQVMVTIYFSLTYSAGIPLLFFTASASLFVQFLVDKFMILNFYRTPPLYTNEIVVWICKGMKTGTIVHAAFAVLMFSEPSLFPFNNDVSALVNQTGISFDNTEIFENGFFQRITGTPAVFMTVLTLLLILYLVLRQFEEGINFLLRLGAKLTFILNQMLGLCFQCSRGKQQKETDKLLKEHNKFNNLRKAREQVRFDSSAVQGISSYNILANPLYSSKFRLKDNKSYGEVLSENGPIHSTAQVMNLLDRGDSKRQARLVFQRSSTTNLRKASTMESANPKSRR